MSSNQRTTILRFAAIFAVIALGFVAVLIKIILIQTTERSQWMRIANNQVKTNQTIYANRGNILDADGRIMTSSMPQFIVYMDASVTPLHAGGDTLLHNHIDHLCANLSHVIGDKSPEQYRRIILCRKSDRSVNQGTPAVSIRAVCLTEFCSQRAVLKTLCFTGASMPLNCPIRNQGTVLYFFHAV